MLSPGRKPKEIARAELLAPIENNTAKYLADMKFQDEWKKKRDALARPLRWKR